MKKYMIISMFCLLFLVGCGNKSKTTNEESSTSVSSSTKQSSETSGTNASETVSSETSESSTIDSESLAKQEQEQKLAAYNQLSTPLKVLLLTTIVDWRADTPGLVGYGLGYQFEGDNVFVQIGSGAGSGHPIYKLTYDNSYIYPLEGVVKESYDSVVSSAVSTDPVSKILLYDKYLANKDNYDSSLDHISESDTLSVSFDQLKALIQ